MGRVLIRNPSPVGLQRRGYITRNPKSSHPAFLKSLNPHTIKNQAVNSKPQTVSSVKGLSWWLVDPQQSTSEGPHMKNHLRKAGLYIRDFSGCIQKAPVGTLVSHSSCKPETSQKWAVGKAALAKTTAHGIPEPYRPKTLNPKPKALNPKPKALNPKPKALITSHPEAQQPASRTRAKCRRASCSPPPSPRSFWVKA